MANFTPLLEKYSGQGAFRYWCQTVLPLVYDDSLSYYELLNKMVVYLNNTISDVAAVETNVDRLLEAYELLQGYVNSYFDNLSVQDEVDHKLDEMASSGVLSELLDPLVDDKIGGVVAEQIDEAVEEQIDASVGRQLGEVVESQIEPFIGPVVTEWLDDNVEPVGSAVVVDSSLTIAGAAADAKATGDKINSVDNEANYKINGITEPTLNIFDIDKAYQIVERNASWSYLPNGIKITQTAQGTYARAEFIYPTNGANTVYVAGGWSYDGNGVAVVRIGGTNDLATYSWRGTATEGNAANFSISGYDYVVIALYSSFNVAGAVDDYCVYKNVCVSFYNIQNIFSRSAVDLSLRESTALDFIKVRRAKYLFSYRTSSDFINYNHTTHILTIPVGFTIHDINNLPVEIVRVSEAVAFEWTTGTQIQVIVYDTSDSLFKKVFTYSRLTDTQIPICLVGYAYLYGLDIPYMLDGVLYGIQTQGNYQLPDFWKNKIEGFKTAQKDNFAFLVQTDVHYYLDQSDSYALNLNALTHYIGLDFAANLGDFTRGYADQVIDSNENMRAAATQIMERYLTDISCAFFPVIGNHEMQAMYHNAYGTDYIYQDEWFGRLIRPAMNTAFNAVWEPGKLYYYADYPLVRVIVLNTNERNGGLDFGVTSEQVSWFENAALDTDKAVVVLSHVPLVNGWSVNSNYHESFADIINKLIAFKNNGGTVVGCFCGHVHVQESKTVNGILHVSFDNGGDRCEGVIVDLASKSIETITFGVNSNRSFTYT